MDSPSDAALLQENRFILQSLLGEGSYAKVYKVIHLIDETRGIELACKIIETKAAPRRYATKFLPRELEILINVNHPHIIHVTNIFQRRTKYFILMRLGENGDLLSYITKYGAICEAQCRVWIRQLLSALQYIHKLNIAHRDLKCENILITKNYNVKLTDFGFARHVWSATGDSLSETYCGSLLYAAPEILTGVPYLPKQADIWSMGIILYAMLNKAMPFNETSAKKLHMKQVQKYWKFRSAVVNQLSTECKQQVTVMLDPDPQNRPSAEGIFNGPWISMEPRLLKLTAREESLLKNADDYGFEMRKKRRGDTRDFEILSFDGRNDGLKTLKYTDFQKYSRTSGPFGPDDTQL